jgi:hypothetical protein
MFQVGETVVWYRWDKQRRDGDAIHVKIAKISRVITVEVPLKNGGTRRRVVARDELRPVKAATVPGGAAGGACRRVPHAWRARRTDTDRNAQGLGADVHGRRR